MRGSRSEGTRPPPDDDDGDDDKAVVVRENEAHAMRMARVPLLVLLAFAIVAIRDAIDVCGEAFGATALVADGGMSTAGRCLFREVLWAEEARVSFVPE